MRLLSTLIGVVIASASVWTCSSEAQAASQPALVTPPCAWPIATNAVTLAENSLLNIHNPDAASDYWIMSFTVQPRLRITLSGRYPASRYFSFAVYSSEGTAFTTNGVASTLTDYRIAPNHGSVNPWQHPGAPGGQYTMTVSSDAEPGQTNTLPLAPQGTPAGTVGLLFLRIYAARSDPSKISLPIVTFQANGTSQRLPTCPASAAPHGTAAQEVLAALGLPRSYGQSATPTITGPPARPGTPGAVVPFAAFPTGTGHTVDTDTAYLFATVVPPQNGDVLVIRAKAPSTPKGTTPVPWPTTRYDMRYWSICDDLEPSPTPVVINRLHAGQVDEGCRDDNQIALDRSGDYTIVVGTEAQRGAIARIPDTTYLPFSSAAPTAVHKLALRNMLPVPTFLHAVQDVPADGNSASAEAVMGPYYPRSGFCSLTTLAKSGPDACLAGAQ
jgi:hypothetical protein